MDKISISNLFPTSSDFRPLDVYSLYNTKEQRIQNQLNFNIDRLVKLREEKKNKIFIQYDKIFNMCLKKINRANDLYKTEVIFDIPEGIYGQNDYNPLQCIEYINKKLHDMCLDTLILNKSIYISWLNLGENLKKDKEKDKEDDNRNNNDNHN